MSNRWLKILDRWKCVNLIWHSNPGIPDIPHGQEGNRDVGCTQRNLLLYVCKGVILISSKKNASHSGMRARKGFANGRIFASYCTAERVRRVNLQNRPDRLAPRSNFGPDHRSRVLMPQWGGPRTRIRARKALVVAEISAIQDRVEISPSDASRRLSFEIDFSGMLSMKKPRIFFVC